ncbi:hypothetical protein GCM10008171_17170 [Methylopila jiangsuensis]|uniref:Tetratricopeptide repeat protein n=1 Tax=Methylopila jiangsuensis TaxID=586230 RepID=A0A9W6JJ34_9HYPH|nr:hypothetical protein [Methylopila jiangsuensis]MDR6284025.1 tetratricopeptide (TPR) repeat protein [Methylopila jiangsuensis]GLK76463.1 hypothetical protein GCM10008171_17170 [Methylopila jiangsuensis]
MPLVEVGSVKFEELCRDVLQLHFPDVTRTSLKRRRGQEQFGVDVEGFDELGRTTVVISAKCYRKVEGWHFRPWIEEFCTELDRHWKDKGVTDFVLAVTDDCNDDDINDSARLLIEELKQRGITFHLWGAQHLTDLVIKGGPQLVDRYFYRGWYDVLSGSLAAGASATSGALPVAPQAPLTFRQETEELLSILDKIEITSQKALEAALEADRAGRSNALRQWLADTRADSRRWQALTAETQAKALRAQAVLHLRDSDVSSAEALLDEADLLSPPPDRSARAMALNVKGETREALELLSGALTPREREIRAGLLIEIGDLDAAAQALENRFGSEVSPEMLRLRAILAMIRGDRETALQFASSAVDRDKGAFAPLMTRGAIHVFCALAPGATAQFGGPLTPIHPGLVRNVASARRHLGEALKDFDRLLEGDRPSKTHVETWRLGCLLLHPDRQTEAASECRQLLRRDPVDPVVVLWSWTFGRLHRLGKIKKSLVDAVRFGSGTETHLLALATLCAGVSRPDLGLRVITQHQHRFPASGALLDSWRIRFGDASLEPSSPYERATRDALAGDCGALVACLQDEAATAEDVVAGVGFLASRSAWADIVRVRGAMLRIATPRLLRLAAVAALRVEDAAGCLDVIDAAEAASPDLPDELIGLRMRANEMLGRYQPVIEDLRALQRQTGEASKVGGLLLDAYHKIGALPQLAKEARRAMAAGELGPNQMFNVAVAMRRYDDDLAREALRHAVAAGLDGEATPHAFLLALELGLEEVQRKIVEATGNPLERLAVRSFQNIEDILAYMEERNEDYRGRFDAWLRGEVPAAVAMIGDLKGYARLFLAEPAERRNLLNETFPMLLLSGARRRPPCTLAETRPTLRLDLSALMLAARLDMLDAVEAAFSVETPASLPDALSDLDAAFSDHDPKLAAAVRKAVSPDGPVRVVEDLEPGCVELEAADAGRDLNPEALRRMSEAAFAEGHLDRDQLAKLQSLADPELAQTPWGAETPSSETSPVHAGRFGVWRLVLSGALDPLARSTPIHILRPEADALIRELTTLESDAHIKAKIMALRDRMSRRLLNGEWTVARLLPSETHAPAPAHMRCLIEVLGKQERAPALMWVEDRAFSHNPPEQALCVAGVLDSLRQKGMVDDAYVRQRVNRLMAAGYAYLPVEALEVSRKLFDAPIHENGLVETQELAALRIWCAQESERLRWLDMTQRHDADGRIAGELRRALDIDLAHRALVEIWSRAESDHDAARARSAWVWTHLRQPAPFSPPEPGDAHVRAYVAVHLAHALTIPLFSEFSSKPIPRDAQVAFADWFVQSAVSSLKRADPETFRLFVEAVTGTVARIVDREGIDETGMDEGLRASLDRRMVAVASRFLDLLPERLVDQIVEHGDLGRRLPRRSVIALTLTDDASLPLDAFADAAGALLQGGEPAKLPIALTNKQPAWVEARRVDGELELSILFEEARFRIAEETQAMVHPDLDVRLAAINRHYLDRRSAITAEEFGAALRLTTAAERFEAVRRLRENDVFSRLSLIRSKVFQREPLAIDDLSVPSIAAMDRFLLRTETASVELVSRREVQDLAAVVGARAAIERLASSPVDFSGEALAAVFALMAKEEPQTDPDAVVTPLEALLRLRAGLQACEALNRLKDRVSALAASCARHGTLFVALARYGALDLCRRTDRSALPSETLATYLWCYADQMLRALAPDFVDAHAGAGIIAGRTQRTFRDVAAFDAMPRWARDMTADLTTDRLLLGVTAVLIDDGAADRDATLLDPLQALVGGVRDDAWWPPADELTPPPQAPDVIWPARDVVPRLIAGGWLPGDHPFAIRGHDVIARRILDEALEDEAGFLRSCLLSHVDAGRVEPSTLARMKATLVADPGAAGLEPHMAGSQMILSAWAHVLATLDEDAAMAETLATFARRCARRWSDHPSRAREGRADAFGTLQMLEDVALTHSIALPRPRVDQLKVFAATMTAVANAWPNVSRHIAESLHRLADAAEAPDAVPLWRAATRLRAQSA